ncbi:IclR family transcriptional regulator [Microlunatus sp. GCM10028923]|uniref:IclR family transcriptional regulator n=1 Tax=Microlunatus sp. GCM10028923 TaxID=3273400 RepID=UPI00361A491E
MLRPADQSGDPSARSSLLRGLALLDLFSEHDVELSISEMARRSGIPKSTTHRLVGDLESWGALERGPRGMRLGVRLFELGHLVPDHAKLRELTIPYAHTLNEITRLTCNVAVPKGSEIIYIEKISPAAHRVNHYRPGGRAPMHATGLGKAILAFSSPALVESVLSGPLEARTGRTITRPDQLRRELARIRESRIAYDVEESRPGLFCVAAPVFARRRTVVGAISVTGATELAQARQFAPVVRSTAMAISRALDAGGRHRAAS